MESDKSHGNLSLSEAQRLGRIDEFIAQEEARRPAQVSRAEFDRVLAKVIKAPRSEGQTSHSPSRDGSTGKRTRQGNGRRISS
jgi:hypothetical protein